MKRHVVLVVVFAVALGSVALVARKNGMYQSPSVERSSGVAEPAVLSETCVADECLLVSEKFEFPAGTLSSVVREALEAALEDEYRAAATYTAVLEKFGMRRPFSMIIRAEEQHISRLKALYDKYGIAVPENEFLGTVTAPESFSVACRVGVAAEIANADLYDKKLIPSVATYPDIVRVFENLRDASEQRHLPAFERCS